MLKRKGYTLTEILVVLVIIVTLAALAWPNYMRIKESALNREAKASLALIRAAEKIYRLEQGFYYPRPAGTTDVVSDINNYLKLSLPESASPPSLPLWKIIINSTTSGSEVANVTRNPNGGDGRIWVINLSDNLEPNCSGTTNCK